MLHRRKLATATPKHGHGRRNRPGAHRPEAATGQKSGLLLFVLLIAQLMVILDITAVNIALPSLAADLNLAGSSISWTITSYSLIFGSLLLFGGRAADLLGRRRMFLTGLGIFTASSFASAMAGTAGALFAARAGQGLGQRMLSPAALAIIMSAFQGHQRAKALAAWGAVGGAGAAIGVLVGGLLTEFTDWRMIFYVNIPVAAALAIAAVKIIPADTQQAAVDGSRPPRRSARHHESRRDRLRDHSGRGRGLDFGSDAPVRAPAASQASRPSRPRAPHRHTAPADRAARRSRSRRRTLPDARRSRFDLRTLPAQLALPPERARLGAALDRPRLRPARPRRRSRRARSRPHRQHARRPRPTSPAPSSSRPPA